MEQKKPVLIVSHGIHRWVGQLAPILKKLGFNHQIVAPQLKEKFPDTVENYSMVILLGGMMGVYDTQKHPWLLEEFSFIKKVLAQELPVLGICLGCQMLAHVTGGKAYQGQHGKELGFITLKLHHDDKIFGHELEDCHVLQWHADTYKLSQNSAHLASGPLYTQQAACFAPRVYGVQFHPEATSERVEHWHREDIAAGLDMPDSALCPITLSEKAEKYLPAAHIWLEAFLNRVLMV